MKIAHFAAFAPHGAGQYETVRDLIKAERIVGIEAEFVDYAFQGKMENRVGLQDGHITTVGLDYAKEADVLFRHSAIPPKVEKETGKPVVLCLHGRPESTWRIGFGGEGKLIETIIQSSKKPNYKEFITFWEPFVFYWQNIIPAREVRYIPTPVDLMRYNPVGGRHKFHETGEPNIVIADLWRLDDSPFNVIFAVEKFRQKYCNKAKLHIYGLPKEEHRAFLAKLRADGLFGDFFSPVAGLSSVYRAADLVVTPHIIATRVVREALASGCPLVGGEGNPYTEFQANAKDIDAYAAMINKAWVQTKDCRDEYGRLMRRRATNSFNLQQTGEAIKKLIEGKILNAN